MKRIIAITVLCMAAACAVQADSFLQLCLFVDQVQRGDKEAALALFEDLKTEDRELAASISPADFRVACATCGGDGSCQEFCDRCEFGNQSLMAGGDMQCMHCKGSRYVTMKCTKCLSAGVVVDRDGVGFLRRRLNYYYSAYKNPLAAWLAAKADLHERGQFVGRDEYLRCEVAQVLDDGIHALLGEYGADRIYITGINTAGLYEGKVVSCRAWPVGTESYSSVLGARITIRKYAADLWGDW